MGERRLSVHFGPPATKFSNYGFILSAGIAQLAERLATNQKVIGSKPISRSFGVDIQVDKGARL
jgi:hypothetical protein